MKKLGIAIREQRKRLKLKTYQLADKVGVTSEFITKIEKGQGYPSPKVLKRICEHLVSDFRSIYFKERHSDIFALMKRKIIIRSKIHD